MFAAGLACGEPAREDASRTPGAPAVASSATGSAVGEGATADDGQWTMPARDYASTRYSALSQITTQNVRNLRPAWTFSTGVLRGHEAAPLVVGSTMYVTTPYPNHLYAIDLTPPGGALKWRYDPEPSRAAQGVACCDVVNRGA